MIHSQVCILELNCVAPHMLSAFVLCVNVLSLCVSSLWVRAVSLTFMSPITQLLAHSESNKINIKQNTDSGNLSRHHKAAYRPLPPLSLTQGAWLPMGSHPVLQGAGANSNSLINNLWDSWTHYGGVLTISRFPQFNSF